MVFAYMPIKSLAVNMRSIRLMVENTLVSFSRKIRLASRPGTLELTARGRITYPNTYVGFMPKLWALSVWMGAMFSSPLRKVSAM